MARLVYAFPPVGLVGHNWTEDAPVSKSMSLLSGKQYVSSAQRKRRMATLTVSSLAGRANRSGAGYMEMLKKLLAGGENLVRLKSPSINWHLDAVRLMSLRQSHRLIWTDDETELDWSDNGTDMNWYEGNRLTGVPSTDGVWPTVTVTGLAASSLAARPGEFITAFADDDDATGETVQAMRETWSDKDGVAVIRLMSVLGTAGRINIGTSETAVFEVQDMGSPIQPLRGDWRYTWTFKEVFADEVDGFTELDPWN